MITDRIENIKLYQGLGERISEGLNYISSTNLDELAPGKYHISDEIYAMISEYNTKEENICKPESHIKYLDIQVIISGSELIGYAPLIDQKPSVEYNAEKDLIFYDTEDTYIKLDAGMFAIFFPTDIHRPCVKVRESEPVKKLVIKVLV